MARYWNVTQDGETTFVSTGDDQDPSDVGYDKSTHTWVERDGPPTADDSTKAGLEGNPFAAHEWARRQVDDRVAAAIVAIVPEAALAGFILDAHAEVQIFKLMADIQTLSGLNLVPAGEELQKRFPNVMAVSAVSNVPPDQVAEILEERYWPRVKAIVLARASQIVAYDAIANSMDVSEMVDIAGTTDLNPGGMT